MYDGHIYSEQYKDMKDRFVDYMNGDIDLDIEEFAEEVQDVYDSGNMSSTQYDDLMRYIQDFI